MSNNKCPKCGRCYVAVMSDGANSVFVHSFILDTKQHIRYIGENCVVEFAVKGEAEFQYEQ
jgi:hypothetical protein